MGAKEPSYPYATGGEASILKRSPSRDNPMVAVGYTNGVVRLFNYLTETLVCSLKGHRSAITSLCYDDDGALLVTGSGDSDIVLWDLVTHTALSRLRGHKDAVHGVGFISALPSDEGTGAMNKTRRLLVSVSKDTLLKVRPIVTPLSHACIQGLLTRCTALSGVGPRQLQLRPDSGGPPMRDMVIAGAQDKKWGWVTGRTRSDRSCRRADPGLSSGDQRRRPVAGVGAHRQCGETETHRD